MRTTFILYLELSVLFLTLAGDPTPKVDLQKGLKPNERLVDNNDYGTNPQITYDTLTFFLNTISKERKLLSPTKHPKDPNILVVNLDSYGILPEAWDEIAEKDPYNKTKKMVRADWFIVNAAVGENYYNLEQTPRTLKKLRESLQSNNDLYVGIITDSELFRFSRRAIVEETLLGSLYLIQDRTEPHPDFMEDMIGGKVDQTWAMIPKKNGLYSFAIYDSKEIITPLPNNLLSAQVRPGLTCYKCHNQGPLEVQDTIRLLLKLPKVKLIAHTDKATQALTNQFKGEFSVEKGRSQFQQAKALLFPSTPKINYEHIEKTYNQSLSLEDLARELKRDPAELKAHCQTRQDPMLLRLAIDPDARIRRHWVEKVFSSLQSPETN